MLVMHGFWLAEPGLCLWAEDSELLVKSDSQAYRSARPHPFAAQHAALHGTHTGKPSEATLLLPSLRSAPPELRHIRQRAARSAGERRRRRGLADQCCPNSWTGRCRR